MHKSTKTFNFIGSTCFRQWRAVHSHCSLLHGYSLTVKIVFAADKLDHNNWVQDFGGLKTVKRYLESLLDHTVVVAEDDPEYETFQMLDDRGLISLRRLPRVGCEAFAEHIYTYVDDFIPLREKQKRNLRVDSVEVSEHHGNSAIYCSRVE